MKFTFSVEAENRDDIKIYATAIDTCLNVDEALEFIRSRLKYGDPLDAEIQTLENIRMILLQDE